MTGPIIPAGQWPEGAVALVWSAAGLGKWVTADSFTGTWEVALAGVPMPAGYDWRVPVLRTDMGIPMSTPATYQVRPRDFPAGEGWREVSKREFDNYGDFPGYLEDEWERRKLYAAPQPALDLEQFREAVGYMIDCAETEAELSRARLLLDLIDGWAEPDMIGDALSAMGNAYPLTGAGMQAALDGDQPAKGEGVACG